MRRWLSRVGIGVLLAAAHAAAAAQVPSQALVSCDGRTVSEIAITPRDPSFLSFPAALRPIARAVGLHHTTSKESAIRSFVLLEVGEPCSERQRAETERILRLQPFIADATVRTVVDAGGGTRVEIETIDEIPTVLSVGFRDRAPSSLRFGNGNVEGQGIHLAGRMERGFAYRTGVGVDATARQLFGRPYTLSFAAERAPLGSTLAAALGHPFFTDLQRTAWHAGFRREDGYLPFARPEDDALSLEVRRRLWNLGGVRRLGLGRHSAFAGLLITAEAVTPASLPVVVSDSGLVADTTGALGGPYSSYRNLRLNAVVGVRTLSFMAVRGFDALTAVQDVATGLQLGGVLGQGISRFGAGDDNLFVAADLYAGRGSPTSFVGVRGKGEARLDSRTGRWDSMVGSGRIAWYLKPGSAHVLIGSVELGGGWRQRIPFQLRLGDAHGGVRGFSRSRLAGGARSVVRLEERWTVGALTRHGTFGLAGFVDAGWVWALDAPFGVDTGMKVGVGVGLLAAFPPESPRTWRLDLALPVSADPHARWQIRLSSSSARSFWQEPYDVARGRADAVPSAIFGWP